MNKTVIVIALVIILLGGFALVQSQRQSTPATTTTTTETTGTTSTTSEPTTATTPAEGEAMTQKSDGTIKEFTVTGKNFSFSPNTITINKGDTVKITFKNDSGFHDFVIDEFNVATKQIQSNASETIEFVADKTGNFEYYCSVGNHRAQGMKGTLTVK